MLALGALAVSIWFIWKQISAGYTAISIADIHLDLERLTVTWLCTAAATALGAWEWVLLVNALGGDLDLAHGMSIHLTSNLVKYVPGFIWSYAGKAYLTTRHGVSTNIAVLSITGEFVIVYFSGVLLMLLCLPFSGLVSWTLGQRLAFQVGAIVLTGISIVMIPVIARWSARRGAHAGATLDLLRKTNWSRVAFVMVAVLLTWCLLGFGFSVLYGQVSSDGWSHLLRHSFALASALMLGQVVFFAPTGLGVREAVLVALLAMGDTTTWVVILAVVFRIVMMVGEVVCALIALVVSRLSRVSAGRIGLE
jgi:uncharacterized membrane protein YbhN (UPF0104 family)